MVIFAKERMLTPSWDLIRPSVQLVRAYGTQVIYLSVLPTLLAVLALIVFGEQPLESSPSRQLAGVIMLIVAALWSVMTYAAYLYLQVHAAQGKEVSAMDAFKKATPRLPALVGASLAGTLLIILGFIALIVPGLILVRGFLLAPYYIVDQKLGPIEALRRSYKDSKPVSAWIWGIIGVEVAISIVTSAFQLIPIVGYIIAVAASYIYAFAPAIRYNEIVNNIKVPRAAQSIRR